VTSTLKDWLADHPPPDSAFSQSLAGVALRVRAGQDFWPAVRELLDEFNLLQTDEQRLRAIADEPGLTDDRRYDAYLAGLGEHLALRYRLARPEWTIAPGRFLDRFWFVSDVKGLRAIAIAQSPIAFRRRGVFVPARSLERV
jgi:hypothetical protein